MFSTRFSLCVLFYGDHVDLAQRCLGSIKPTLAQGRGWIQDVRVGLNEVTNETVSFVKSWATSVWREQQIPALIWQTDKNVFKYPLMRRMFYDPERPVADLVMWFDDDSFLEGQADWWVKVVAAAERHDMIGQPWYLPMQQKQWKWIQQQPWFNPAVGLPPKFNGRPSIRFCQGAWWVIRSEVLRRFDWPIEVLRHNGGDSLLGELCRHQGLKVGTFSEGVRINADEQGKHSGMKRRGYSEPVIGAVWQPSDADDLAHQRFQHNRFEIGNWEAAPTVETRAASVDENYRRALASQSGGDLEAAERLYREVLRAAPNHADTWHALGCIAIRGGRAEEAARCIGRAVELNPTSGAFHSNLGLAFRQLGRLESAAEAFRNAARLSPDHTVAYKNLGVALLELHRWEEAEASFRQALDIDEHDADARRLLGNALLEQDKLDEAVTCFQRTLESQSESIEARYHLGVALQKQQRYFEASSYFEEVLAFEPKDRSTREHHTAARQQLQRLRKEQAAKGAGE